MRLKLPGAPASLFLCASPSLRLRRLRPQLKRDPLGSARTMRAIQLVLLSAACAATATFSEAVARFPVTRSEVPLSVQDTIVALSIREAVLHGIPDFAPGPEVVS